MRRKGIPVPSIKIFDRTSRAVSKIYIDNLEKIRKELLENAEDFDVEKTKSVIVKDSIENLIKYLKTLENTLESSITYGRIEDNPELMKLKNQLNTQFKENEKYFFENIFDDSDEKFAKLLISFSLDKDKIFQSKIDNLRELYINNALERIKGEQDDLKKSFLEKITKWTEGKEKELDVKDLIKEMKKTSVQQSRFFARDQYCKFNKALLISSLKEADCEYVIYSTVKDRAVRDTHRALEGKIFHIDNLPKELWEYNCRCSLSPIWEEEYAKYGLTVI